jgi:hypothetical protein
MKLSIKNLEQILNSYSKELSLLKMNAHAIFIPTEDFDKLFVSAQKDKRYNQQDSKTFLVAVRNTHMPNLLGHIQYNGIKFYFVNS